jgi:hypothetical protein
MKKNAPTVSSQSATDQAYFNTLPELLDGVILRHIRLLGGKVSLSGIVQSCKSEGFEHLQILESVDCLRASGQVKLTIECDAPPSMFKRVRAVVELVGV